MSAKRETIQKIVENAKRARSSGKKYTAEITITLDAQSHLQAFYERSGYSVCGPTFHEEHVLHVPMRTYLGEPRTC